MSQPHNSERTTKIKNVIRVSSGNFLEMYDFIVFGYYAAAIGRTFFPGHDPYALLMLIGCLIIPLLFLLRRSLEETEAFQVRKHHPTIPQIISTLAANWTIVLAGVMLVAMTTVSFYLITAYTPTFGQSELHLTSVASLLVTLCVGLSNFIWLPPRIGSGGNPLCTGQNLAFSGVRTSRWGGRPRVKLADD